MHPYFFKEMCWMSSTWFENTMSWWLQYKRQIYGKISEYAILYRASNG